MKGSVSWQVTEIFKELKSIGESKYEAKNNARQAGAVGSADIAKETGIYSFRTFDAYRESVVGFAEWAKENLHLRDLTKTAAADVKDYLDSRINSGVAHNTFAGDKAALNKFQTALNRYSESHNFGRNYDFKLNESFNREIHKSLKHADVRAYCKADANKIKKIANPAVNLAVRTALGAGLRKSEILKLSADNLKPGAIKVMGSKGGKDRIVSIIHDKNVIDDLKNYLEKNNISKLGDVITGRQVNYYIAKATGNSGSIHAGRHNYTIETVKSGEKSGLSHIEAAHEASVQDGHNRAEIVENVYLK
ncbi:MAG: tyrosine-type recombinase/integrase [bacterium]